MMFEIFLMQIPEVDSIINMIQAIGVLAGTLGAIITPMMLYLRSKVKKADKRANEAIDLGEKIGLLSTCFSQKTAEQQDEIRMMAEMLYKMSPDEAQQWLKNNRKNIDSFANEAIVANEQLKRLTRNINERAKANNLRHLPRSVRDC